MYKKICFFIIVIPLFFFTMDQGVTASPNVQECLEEDVDCEDLETEANENESEMDENEFVVENEQQNNSLALDLVKMFFALVLVLALIYIALKFLGKRNSLYSQVKALENLGGISLGPNRSIQIIRIGSKVYLIGVGENVEMLEEVTDQQMIDELLKNKEHSSGFLQNTLFSSKAERKNSPNENAKRKDFTKLFANELDKMKQNRNSIVNQYHSKEDHHE